MPYLSALEVCSRRGAVQIHFHLTLPYLNTHSKTATLTSPTLKPSPTQQKFSLKKVISSSAWEGALTTYPIIYAKKISFFALGVHVHPVHPWLCL